MWSKLETALIFVANILHLKISDDKIKLIIQFIKFGIVGLSNTIVSYVIYLVSLKGFEQAQLFKSTDYLIAQLIAFILSVLWSFMLNSRFVFNEANDTSPWYQILIKTYASYAFTGLFLNSILSIFWIEVIRVSKVIAPIFNLLISVPINFVLNKFWAFKS